MSDDRIESHEERLLVLRDKAAREGFVVGDDVLDYIAGKYALGDNAQGRAHQRPGTCVAQGRPGDRCRSHGWRSTASARRPRPLAPGVTAVADDGSWAEPADEPADEWAREPELAEPDADIWDEPVIEPGSGTPTAATPGPDPEPVAGEAGPDRRRDGDTVRPASSTVAVRRPVATAPAPAAVHEPARRRTSQRLVPEAEPAVVWFAPMRSIKKESLVKRVGNLLQCRRHQARHRRRRSGRDQASLRRRGQHRLRAAHLPARGRAPGAQVRCASRS